ncbi:hypothetical protein [Sediminibacterium sp.]|uniref:DUF6843 domain-containing protein n=1 Tax=Sediminibacterium sp. TaxID=1917865 RepID=UPI0025F93F1D|nr:hypothetical protein [Sediminibacterium sp.]MBW0176593.1 hypothetical protein [Sediminibacterium sp.]
MKKRITIITCSLLLIILIAVVWEWVYIKTTAKEEVFVLPRNFKGIVLIAYDQKDGMEDIKEDGKLVYKIPVNGILKLKRKEVTTLFKSWYFIENENGNRTVLNYCFPPCEEMRKETAKIFAFGGGNRIFFDEQLELKTSIFLVGTATDIDSLNKVYEKINAIELLKNSK